jgi:outer membrane protein assembly factor BamB
VSIPSLLGTRNAVLNETASVRAIREEEYVIFGTAGRNDERGAVKGWLMAVSLKPGQEGQRLWESTFTPPLASFASNVTISLTGIYPEDGVILFESSKLLKRWGYNMTTGAFLWEGEREPEQNYYSMADNVYEGKLLTTGFGGILLAYNMTTGKVVWNFTAAPVGFECPYGNYPINIFAIADGKIYTLTGEHSISQPMFRGPNLRCINASNGVELWNLLNFGANGGASLGGIAVWFAEGKVVGLNYFDNQIYCIGIGKSATTVSAPQTAPALGSSVTITGTVTDQTPTGRRNTNDIIDWTLKDTPAISDADMGRWMEYMFQQQIYPANAKGVNVTLTAIDPNNNYIPIGTTTSDASGHYGISWTPEVPGTYQIIATFAGSAAYGSSFSETYMTVGPAPEPPAEIPPEPPLPPFEMYTLYATIAIIIAIGIVGFLILRKKP